MRQSTGYTVAPGIYRGRKVCESNTASFGGSAVHGLRATDPSRSAKLPSSRAQFVAVKPVPCRPPLFIAAKPGSTQRNLPASSSTQQNCTSPQFIAAKPAKPYQPPSTHQDDKHDEQQRGGQDRRCEDALQPRRSQAAHMLCSRQAGRRTEAWPCGRSGAAAAQVWAPVRAQTLSTHTPHACAGITASTAAERSAPAGQTCGHAVLCLTGCNHSSRTSASTPPKAHLRVKVVLLGKRAPVLAGQAVDALRTVDQGHCSQGWMML